MRFRKLGIVLIELAVELRVQKKSGRMEVIWKKKGSSSPSVANLSEVEIFFQIQKQVSPLLSDTGSPIFNESMYEGTAISNNGERYAIFRNNLGG